MDATSETSERETRGGALGYDPGGKNWGLPMRMAKIKPASITRSELAWTSGAIFILGALMGWAISDQGYLVDKAFEKANGAEWIAAVGTWVIGAAAVKYSRAAHSLRQQEVEDQRLKDRTRRNKIRFELEQKMISLIAACAGFESLKNLVGYTTMDLYLRELGSLKAVTSAFSIDAEGREVVSERMSANLTSIQEQIAKIDVIVNNRTANSFGTPINRPLSRIELSELESVFRRARSIEGRARRVAKDVAEEREIA